MGYPQYHESAHRESSGAPTPVKIVIAGGFGVGKTTSVGVISDAPPLTTEAAMTDVAAKIDRSTIQLGCDKLGIPLEDHIANLIRFLAPLP